MAEDKKDGFVVRDKRKFNAEGDVRPGFEPEPEPPKPARPPAAPADASQASAPPPSGTTKASDGVTAQEPDGTLPEGEEMPPPPSAEEQSAQHADYRSAGKQLDSLLQERAGAPQQPIGELTMERLISSMYMQAMMLLGMYREEGVQPRIDIVGARQTIDTLALLQDKTKGNLTERESHMLQNVLFELRMAFVEITKAVTTAPKPGAPGAKTTR